MRIQDLDWEELHTLLAFVRTGSIDGAARELQARPTTVTRRLERLERRLGHAVLDRSGRRSRPDPALLAAATQLRRLESLMAEAFERTMEAVGRERLRLRITTTAALSELLLGPNLARLTAAAPQAELMITSEAEMLSLAERQADFALRLDRVVDPLLVGRKVGDYGYGLYGARRRWARVRARDLDREDFELIGEDDPDYPGNRWLARRFPKRVVRARLDLSASMAQVAAHSDYLALVACFIGDSHPELVRVLGPSETLSLPLYLLAHRGFKRHPAKVAIYRELGRIFEENAGRLRGD